MKTAIFVLCIGDFYKSVSEFTHPLIKEYANKIGADFIECTETKLPYPHYAKLEIYNLLDKYDRILYLDTDILISPNTPNIFDIVPENKLGLLDESILGYNDKFIEFLKTYGKEYVNSWSTHQKCYNAGVIVCSKIHKDLFKLPDTFIKHYWEQSYLNLRILQEKMEVFELPMQYNRMVYLDIVTNEHRLKSYIVHYAGVACQMTIDQFKNLLISEYKMLVSQDFSNDQVRIVIPPN